jgi:hypothetical protein
VRESYAKRSCVGLKSGKRPLVVLLGMKEVEGARVED